MVSQFVPAFRNSIGRWSFGTVIESRGASHEYSMLFDGNVKEWVFLERSPFQAYLASYQRRVQKAVGNEQYQRYVQKDPGNDQFFGMKWTEYDEYKAICSHPRARGNEAYIFLDDDQSFPGPNVELGSQHESAELEMDPQTMKGKPRLWTDEVSEDMT